MRHEQRSSLETIKTPFGTHARAQGLPALTSQNTRSELELLNAQHRFRRSELELRGCRKRLNISTRQGL
eukprot:12857137-Alexandrium_andersonii.AAC.1